MKKAAINFLNTRLIKMKSNEIQELKRTIKSVATSAKAHKDYLSDCEDYLHEYKLLAKIARSSGQEIPIKNFKFIESKLFKRKYLIATANLDWYLSYAPTFDAISTPSMTFFNLESPPLVIIPESSARDKTKKFRGILEHEFVHVNQAILGTFPVSSTFSKKTIETMMSYALAEYQAYLIQYSHFPESFNDFKGSKYSIQDASVLMGYTQALERLVLAILQNEFPLTKVSAVLTSLRKRIPNEFKKMGLDAKYGIQYTKCLPEYLQAAKLIISSRSPLPESEGHKAITEWTSTSHRS